MTVLTITTTNIVFHNCNGGGALSVALVLLYKGIFAVKQGCLFCVVACRNAMKEVVVACRSNGDKGCACKQLDSKLLAGSLLLAKPAHCIQKPYQHEGAPG